MAGMPRTIVDRAIHILQQLEQKSLEAGTTKSDTDQIKNTLQQVEKPMQLSFFESTDPKFEAMKELLNSLDINSLTPVEALMKLDELKKKMDE